jgi:hypothetical protein
MMPGSSISRTPISLDRVSSSSTPIRRSRRWSTTTPRDRSASSSRAPSCFTSGEKFGRFAPSDVPARMERLSWLFWQMDSGPHLGGGFAHFYPYAPIKPEYPINRYAMEVKRQLDVLDRRLADRSYLAENDYSIADIAVFAWYGALECHAIQHEVR